MNGNDLLMYSQMRQHQADLLTEAAALHAARAVARALREPAIIGTEAIVRSAATAQVGAQTSGMGPRPHVGSRVRGPRVEVPARAGHEEATPPGATRLRSVAARVGSSLVAVGRRLERMERR